MKSKEEQKGFAMGMLTMTIASIGIILFNQGSWITYVGLALMITYLVIVYSYIKSK